MSTSPAADAKAVYALFATGDLVCYDKDGDLVWYRSLVGDYPTVGNNVGMAASPALWNDTLLICMENVGESFAAVVVLVETIALHHRAHRAVDDENAARQLIEQRLGTFGMQPGKMDAHGFLASRLNTSKFGGRRSRVSFSQATTSSLAARASSRSSSGLKPRLR